MRKEVCATIGKRTEIEILPAFERAITWRKKQDIGMAMPFSV